MKRTGITAMTILVMLIVCATAVFPASQSGRSCTDEQGVLIVNPECGVNGSDTTTTQYPWYVCEDCPKRSKCEDDKLVVITKTVKYSTVKGCVPCGRSVYKQLWQGKGCGGDGVMPGIIDDWIVYPPTEET